MYSAYIIFVNYFCYGRRPELLPVNELKARRQVVTTAQSSWIARLATLMRSSGPYAAIELLLPGGSLIALSLWIFRHRGNLRLVCGALWPALQQFAPASSFGLRRLSAFPFDSYQLKERGHDDDATKPGAGAGRYRRHRW